MLARSRRPPVLALALALLVLAAACSGSSADTPAAPPAASPALNLKGTCPDPLVVLTSWYPQSEHGAVYQLLGPGYRVHAKDKRVTGPLMVRGKSTGIRLQVRAGGPAIGFQSSAALMYQDPSITLGMLNPDQIIQLSKSQPVLSVVALQDIDPQMIGWYPRAHPDWHTIADIGQTDTRVLYFKGSTYMDYLVGSGILRKRQIDGSYDGSPSAFVASGGQIAFQGYASNEPFTLQHEVKAWSKPIAFQLIYDTGYPNYANVLAVRPDRRSALDACLHRLVPLLQQAQVDFMGNPSPTIDLILKLDQAYKGGFVYSRGNAEFAVAQMRRLGIVGNGSNQTIGDFDTGRLARLIQIVTPILAGQHTPIKPRIGPVDVATNAYVNPSIGLKG